jgi:nucleoside-diphosphate-sugar epimerase
MKLLIFGFGYSAQRLALQHRPAFESLAGTVRSSEKAARLRQQGLQALYWPDAQADFEAAFAAATHLLISTPPDEAGDPVLRRLGARIAARRDLAWIGYWSTVAVYGDQHGGWVDEATPARPGSPRGQARLAAEQGWADVAGQSGAALHILRLPGIYGPGRSAIDQLRDGTARRLIKPGQVFNRIHVDDIAGATLAAMRAASQLAGTQVFNITDDEPAPPQDVVAHAAALLDLPCPPETPFETATLGPMARSFYGENKRVANRRMRDRLGYRLRYPTYREGLAAIVAEGQAR